MIAPKVAVAKLLLSWFDPVRNQDQRSWLQIGNWCFGAEAALRSLCLSDGADICAALQTAEQIADRYAGSKRAVSLADRQEDLQMILKVLS